MDELRETALAYYANLPESQKQLASEFFKSLDSDGDGKIDVQEYVNALSNKGFKRINSAGFFKELDKDRDGSLDFDEVLTLFYMMESGRLVFCDGNGCGGAFLKGVYFTCLTCNPAARDSFDLCCSCYRNRNFQHHDKATFVDNYVLLQHQWKHLKKGKMENASTGAEAVANIFQLADLLSTLLSS